MKDYLVLFYTFGFVLVACSAYALLLFLKNWEEFVSNTEVKNWRESCAHRLW